MTETNLHEAYVKGITKVAAVTIFERYKKDCDFNIALVTKPLNQISIYDLPFRDIPTFNKCVDHNITTAYDLFHTDLEDLSKFLSTDELKEVMKLGDECYDLIKLGVMDLQ